MNETKAQERLKDLRAARAAMIQRREDTDAKLAVVEKQISKLREKWNVE